MDDPATLQTSVQESLVATTRSITRLAAEDLSFHRSLNPSLGSSIDKQNARLLNIAERLLGSATTNVEAVRPSLKDINDVEDNWGKVVDVIDSLLERADTALDEFTGAVKRLIPKDTPDKPVSSRQLAAAFRNQNIDKPQLLFANRIDNRPTEPFQPLLTNKPFSGHALQTEPTADSEDELPHFQHPYKHEIKRALYPFHIYEPAEPIPFDSFEDTSAVLVDTEEALEEMLAELKTATEIAIDLEHHDRRSYTGIVCLMQISTRHKDWIVDTLKPWRRKLQCLNEVFANPNIIKVLHGAHMDAIWLQRDLGLYLVGLFDTYHASRVLGYPAGSYAYLLKRFTNVDAQKQYQMADWRIRPLPQELVDYARSDTHYLLYIFDHMRNELLSRSNFELPNKEGDRIHDVLQRSQEVALQRYEYPTYDVESGQGAVGWYKMLTRAPVMLSKEQFAVFKALHQWRDSAARDEDESTHFVMPNAQLLTFAQAMPTTQSDLDNISNVSDIVTARADDLIATIIRAKADGADGENMIDALQRIDPIAAAKRAAPSQLTGVGPTLTRTRKDGIIAAATALLPLRTLKSLFWGSAINGTSKPQRRQMSTAVQQTQYQLPLPPVSNAVFTEGAQVSPVVSTPVTPTPAIEPAPEVEDEVFTLRELSRKRKAAETDGLAEQSDQIVLPDEVAERAAAKAERKRAKKEAKRAAKAAVDGEQPPNGHAEEEEPFDYASAPSMLQQSSGKHDKRHTKKQVNPYAKALDTPKGLPRVQKERAGKSMTYAS